MRVMVIGATGTIGKEVVRALQGHDVVAVARGGEYSADIRDVESLKSLFARVGRVDAILCAAGSGAWKPLAELTDDDFEMSLHYKLMGQVNVVRYGLEHVNDGGVIAVTSGVLSRNPMVGSAAISLVNAGLEGFVRAAALEAPRNIRVNVVSPPWVSETLAEMGSDPKHGMPASEVAKAYVALLDGSKSGATIEL